MRIRFLSLMALLSFLLSGTAYGETSTLVSAIVPPGSDVLMGYFRVNLASDRYWIEAWNAEGVTTVRVAHQYSLGTVASLYEFKDAGLLTIDEDRVHGTLDAQIPGVGHVFVQLRCGAALGLTPERNSGGGTYGYELVSPSGQLTPPSYSYTASINNSELVEPKGAVYGRDSGGFTYRIPL